MINLPKNPKINQIPIAVKQLQDIKFDFKKLLDNNLLHKINPDQFLFLMGVVAHSGENFDFNMRFLKNYISRINKSELELLLKIELILHEVFIKKYETEETYNDFYNFFSRLYSYKKSKNNNKVVKKILFYVHSPTFLAHTNALFKLLKSKKDNSVEVGIVANSYNKEFETKCHELGINFYNILDNDLVSSYKKLEKISSNYDRVIWQSVPVHISYFRSLSNKVCYWSLKFHPNIPKLMHYIGIFRSKNKKLLYNNNIWNNINIDFNIENLLTEPLKWKYRKLNFGAFCREELINDENYWKLIQKILHNNKNSNFFYCGKKPIHEKWIKTFNIESSKIHYLGWLKKPHLKLREMSFLLDGFKLGHGYLALEAMAASVPIIFPKNRTAYGNLEDFLIKSAYQFKIKNIAEYKKKFLLNFEDDKELLSITNQLLNEELFNNFYGKQYKKIVSNLPSDSFQDFCNLLK